MSADRVRDRSQPRGAAPTLPFRWSGALQEAPIGPGTARGGPRRGPPRNDHLVPPEFIPCPRITAGRAAAHSLRSLTASFLIALAGPAQAAISTPRSSYPRAIEGLSAYQPQRVCSPTAKPGTVDLSRRLLRAYPGTRSLGIVRACSVGGRSEHKEGRAFDWGGLRASSATDRARVQSFKTWLLRTDKYGNRYAMARRLGVMYVIWNRRIWSATAARRLARLLRPEPAHRPRAHLAELAGRAQADVVLDRHRRLGRARAGARPAPPAPTTTTVRPEPRPAATLRTGPALVDEGFHLLATSSAGALTTGAMQKGTPYLIEVTGGFRWGSRAGEWADAECSRSRYDGTWRRDRSVNRAQPNADHLDLYVDGVDLLGNPDQDTGNRCDSTSHAYRWTYTPSRTGRVTFKIWEPSSYADNSGGLSIRIVRATPRNDMTWTVPAARSVGATSPGALQAGATYVATVSGTVAAGAGVTSDAECSVTKADPTWRRQRSVLAGQPPADHLDVLLDKRDITLEPAIDETGSRCNVTSHIYRAVVRPSEHPSGEPAHPGPRAG